MPPALLARTSIFSYESSRCAASARTSSSTSKSARNCPGSRPPPAARTRSTASASRCGSRPTSTTSSPRAANCSAAANPTPELAPVTTIVRGIPYPLLLVSGARPSPPSCILAPAIDDLASAWRERDHEHRYQCSGVRADPGRTARARQPGDTVVAGPSGAAGRPRGGRGQRPPPPGVVESHDPDRGGLLLHAVLPAGHRGARGRRAVAAGDAAYRRADV